MIILLCFLWLMIGCLKGITDSIMFHNAYRSWGWLWNMDSWTDKQTVFGFVNNWWHRLDYARTGLSMISLLLIPYMVIDQWIILIVPCFVLGFWITYKS